MICRVRSETPEQAVRSLQVALERFAFVSRVDGPSDWERLGSERLSALISVDAIAEARWAYDAAFWHLGSDGRIAPLRAALDPFTFRNLRAKDSPLEAWQARSSRRLRDLLDYDAVARARDALPRRRFRSMRLFWHGFLAIGAVGLSACVLLGSH
ncbi:hypothetical protein ACEUZ9_005467 [Paracoccus litorisediminis]|uniref:hypothetical protein n=1 Tax=Paracoccus litorisediminis TaxID=2006130 RepID=UPI003730032B